MSLRMTCRMKEDETFTVSLRNPGNATLGPSRSIEVTIASGVSEEEVDNLCRDVLETDPFERHVRTVALRTPTGPSLPADGVSRVAVVSPPTRYMRAIRLSRRRLPWRCSWSTPCPALRTRFGRQEAARLGDRRDPSVVRSFKGCSGRFTAEPRTQAFRRWGRRRSRATIRGNG